VQSAFERAWPKWSGLADDRQRRAYLYRVMTNGFRRGRRRRWVGEVPIGEVPHVPVGDVTERAELRAVLLIAVRRLPLRQRTVVALRYLADLSELQTAEAMGCSPGTVKSYTARGMAALRADPVLRDLFREEAKP
jgi:RNA polymerase sigma-70 factor (sigma-E family)